MAKNLLYLVGLFVALVWAGVGVERRFFSKGRSVPVEEAMKHPERYHGKRVALRGSVRMGIEMGDLVAEGRALSTPLPGAAVSLEFLRRFEQRVNGLPFRGDATVLGTLEYRAEGGLGTYGLYQFELRGAEFLRWPKPVDAIVLGMYLLPACVMVGMGVRNYKL